MPTPNTVTRERILSLMSCSQIDVCTKFEKVTVVTVKLPNGFVLVESSGAVDKANYSESEGAKICLARIEARLWQLEGYLLSSRRAAVLDARADELVVRIEALGASPALTDCVVAADELRRAIAGL